MWEKELEAFLEYLRSTEHSSATLEKYERDIKAFLSWEGLNGTKELERKVLLGWKEHLVSKGYAPASVNAKLAALNGFLTFLGKPELKVKFLKVQRRVFRGPDRCLSRKDYERLVREALRSGDEEIALVMETICSTGMRVSEVKFLTLSALKAGKVEVALKGKVRDVLLPKKLVSKLLRYAERKNIESGPVFRSSNGDALSRYSIWSHMKALCKKAKVEASKVFPHNLRHLFAQVFYSITRDIVKLADVLGHTSIETTRIYLMSSGREHARLIERLDLVIEGF